jgi:multicomponent Na+:H+ antiporter subunit A
LSARFRDLVIAVPEACPHVSWVLLAPLVASLAAPTLLRLLGRRTTPWLLAAVPAAAVTVLAIRFYPGEQPLTLVLPWVERIGVELAFRADGLSVVFALLVGWIGGLVTIYAGGYLAGHPRLGRFFLILLLFIAAMLGLVLADNLVVLFVCWELTSITSFFLIGFKHDAGYARDAARKALLTTGAGGLALLGGLATLVVIAQRAAGLELTEATTISVLLPLGETLQADPLFPVALLLILAGAATKSAQMPFHYWLPAAMAGPTPVSALLHSATMVKAGVFLLARLLPVLAGGTLWTVLVVPMGAITMLGGALLALGHRDLKAVLAYTTISALGTLVLLLGIGTPTAIGAMVVFLTVHALYKATLFMVAGNVDHEVGSRDLAHLSGLRGAMPWTAAAALLAALSMGGAPPALGYMGKKLALQAKFDVATMSEWLVIAAVLTNIVMVTVALALAVRPFWGRRGQEAVGVHEAPVTMLAGPLIFGLLGLAVGLVPAIFDVGLGSAAASAIAGETVEIKLKLWSGLSVEAVTLLGISVLAFAVGYVVYRRLHLLWRVPAPPRWLDALTPTAVYDHALGGLFAAAAWHTRQVQRGTLRFYVAVVGIATVVLCGPWLVRALGVAEMPQFPAPEYLYETLLALLIAAGAVAATATRRPIVSVMFAGVSGLGLALVFGLYGGIDLAITQLFVETLLVVVLAAALLRLPSRRRPARELSRLRDGLIATAGGALAAAVVLVAAAGDRPRPVAEEMLARAVPEAYGRNVVNVILVDFRALDTLGEITVVTAAAVGIWVLLRIRKPGGAA